MPRQGSDVRVTEDSTLEFMISHPEGCRIEFVEKPEPGERVWVKFEGLESLEGSVRWVVGHVGGVKFERRIHGGVFERLSTIGR